MQQLEPATDPSIALTKQRRQGRLFMKAIARHSLFIVALIALASCTALRGAPDMPRPRAQAQADAEYLVDPATLAKYSGENDLEKRRLLRNEIIDERMLEMDTQFEKFELTLWQQGVGAGIGTDWVQLAVSGATATAGGAATKSILGAVSAFITGAKASFDKNAFVEKTLAAVLAQMVGEREKIRAAIEQNKQLSVSDYTLFAALSDLRKFMRAGTIPGSLQSIAVDAGQKAAKADDDIKGIRTGAFIKDDAGDRLRAFWKPDGTNIDPANEKRLKEWMQKNSLATGPGDITLFLRDKAMADLRVRAVRELLER